MPGRSQVRLSTMGTILGSIAGAVLLAFAAWSVRQVLLWLFIAFFLALVLNPLVERFAVRMKRPWAVVLVAGIGLTVLGVGLLLIIPPLVVQLTALVKNMPGYVAGVLESSWFASLNERFDVVARLQQEVDRLPALAAGAAEPALRFAGNIAEALFAAITIFFLTFFMLLGGPKLALGMLEPFAPETQARILRVSRPIYAQTTRYALGMLVIASVAGAVTLATLALLGVPYFLPIGFGVAILSFVPFVGATLGGLVSVVVTLVTVGVTRALIVLGVYLVYQQLENHLLQPLIHRQTVRMSPLAITVALLVGAQLAGLIGVILAIPVAGALTIIGRELLRFYKEGRQVIARPQQPRIPTDEPREPLVPH